MIEFTAIFPKKFNMQKILDAAYAAAQKEMNEIESEFFVTEATWKKKVKFDKSIEKLSDSVKLEVSTDDRIYGYVNNGTSVRHAVMSKDWRSKTRPGNIGSGPGSGRVVIVSRKIIRPGIKARKFDKMIANRVKKRFAQKIQKALDEGSKGLWS